MRLSCSVDAMTVKLHTPEAFKGRLFSQDFPNTCKSKDKARTETALVINVSKKKDKQPFTDSENIVNYSFTEINYLSTILSFFCLYFIIELISLLLMEQIILRLQNPESLD